MTSPKNVEDKTEKKMIRSSFAVSLFIHALVLLIIGSIVIVPGAVQKLLPVTSVPTTPVDIPQPPKMEEAAPMDQSLDPGSSPISDQPQNAAPTPDTAKADALVLDTPSSMGPRMDASPGASATITSDVFKQGGQGGSSGNDSGSGLSLGRGLGKATLFGNTEKIDSSLVGKIYDFKQDHDGRPQKFDVGKDIQAIIRSGFSHGELEKYFSPKTVLYSTHLYMPTFSADEGPKAFGVEKTIQPVNFMVYYHGYIAPPHDLTFRFVGYGDDWLIVTINHKVVLDGSFTTTCCAHSPDIRTYTRTFFSWNPPTDYCASPYHPAYGEWITWPANEYRSIDILISETGGAVSAYDLQIQEKDHPYEKGTQGRSQGEPILPLFRVASDEPEVNKNFYLFKDGGPIFKAKHTLSSP